MVQEEKRKKNAKTDRPPKREEPHVRWRSNPIGKGVVVSAVTVAMGESTIYILYLFLLLFALLFLFLLPHYPLLFSRFICYSVHFDIHCNCLSACIEYLH